MSTKVASFIIMLVHLISLNAQGFRGLDKQREIMHFARSQNVDVLFLQEVNFRSPLDISLFRARFLVDAFFTLSNSVASGVGVVFLRPSLRQKAHVIFGLHGRTLAVDFFLGSRKVRAVNVYAPAQRNLSSDFFRSLDVYLFDSYPTFLVGDFNCVLDPIRDVRGPGQGRPYRGARALRELIGQFRLRDAWVHLHGDQFVATWSRGRSGSRLDKFYLPPELIRCLQGCQVLAFPDDAPRISDHAPVSIRLRCDELGPRQNQWRMDPCLLTDPVSVVNIQSALKPEIDRLEQKESAWEAVKDRCREALITEGRQRKVRITSELNETLRRLRIVQGAETLTFAMRDYANLMKARYERLLRQSSRAACQAIVMGRAMTDPAVLRHIRAGSIDDLGPVRITQVRTADGELSSDEEDICARFSNHFAGLFTSEQNQQEPSYFGEAVRAFCNALPNIPDYYVERLTEPATYDELWETLRGMNDASAPGPDGIPLSFYKALFPVLKTPLLRLINTFLDEGLRPHSFCTGRIFLILKQGGDPAEPSSYRPITLLNADYKVVATLLARRISTTLPHIVSLAQTCSVPGRTGFSALSLTRDLFTFATRTGIAGCFVSIDQAKAFDRVEHRYLLAVLGCYGFPRIFVERLAALYTDLKVSLRVNNTLSEAFAVTRGIRQGCPLSPLLFALCIDPLLRRVANSVAIRGFPLPGQGQVKVSAYADDVSLFLRDEDSYTAFLRLFLEYSELSGAQLNRGKSKALRFGAFTSDLAGDVEWVAGVKVLGVTFHASGEAADEGWRELLRKAETKLQVASHFHLSLAERCFVIKSSVCAAFMYTAHVVRPPARVIRRLNTMLGSFFWAGKTERVKRALLRLPRNLGGFSIPCLESLGSLLALRCFRLLADNEDYPGRSLAEYFLGTSRRIFFVDSVGGPSAEQPPPFYSYLIRSNRQLNAELPDADVLTTKPTEICERLAVQRLDKQQLQQAQRANWKVLTSSVLPPDVRDFGWKRAWEILPTGDQLVRWGITPNARCPQCGEHENPEHVFRDCRVAKTFWRLLTRMFGVSLSAQTSTRDACVTFLLGVGALALWNSRGVASLHARPHKAMYPMLIKVRARLLQHLENELAAKGEEAFLQRWSTRFIKVTDNRLMVRVVDY